MCKQWMRCSREIRSLTNELNEKVSPSGEVAATSVRVSNAVPSPSAQTARYRRHVNVTPTVPQEALLSCFHRSHLLPDSNAVSVYRTCLEYRHHAKWTQRTGPAFQEFPELQRMVRAWCAKLQQRQGYVPPCADGGNNVLFGPCGACHSCGRRHFRRFLRVWTFYTRIHRTVETVWNDVFEENV